ncbi:vacuolar import and degradation protein-domain-containing protein [Podospora australis]|uniref:Vacuolar import and degradation protein-domain-containing protein n=1 Tax=Podospora australis TaxID=1536484 RepID=A0AAN6WMQ3_9PEZI|nr:vacuolar import and degradation protein-domain-containing protein [Podospora australis]
MPTPSSNAPDPPSPRSFSFSSCPDTEEPTIQPPSSHPQPAPVQLVSPLAPLSPESPASWTAHAPLPYENDRRTADEPGATRSRDMSPRPQPEVSRDMEVEPEPVSHGMVTAPDTPEDRHKQLDANDQMSGLGNDGGTGAGGSGDGPEQRGVARPMDTAATEASGTVGQHAMGSNLVPVTGAEVHETDVWGPTGGGPRWVEDSGLLGLGYEYSHMRSIPTIPSSFLRPGSKFEGTQESERQRYDVEVEIKHVDMRESFLCGYLKIQGLTDDNPTLTTYFEGEIIGPKYSFITQNPSWGATDKIDLSHWGKFTAFRPYQKIARKGVERHAEMYKNMAQRENLFMRWKEHFLVPDHRVRTINGASFEGFYYICFNQLKGEVSGIYFHSKSEKFQRLELKHVPNRGCYGAMEFR